MEYNQAAVGKRWSPEEVAKRLKKEYPCYAMSGKTIYNYVFFHMKGELKKIALQDLRLRGKKRKAGDAESGRLLKTLEEGTEHIAYSPDGRRIVFASENIIKIWDPESGLKPQTLKGHTDEIICFAYSPDGHRIVSGSNDNTVRIWDAESGCELQTPKEHAQKITSVVYSPNGSRIASGSKDGTIKIWGRE